MSLPHLMFTTPITATDETESYRVPRVNDMYTERVRGRTTAEERINGWVRASCK
jgi:hypothetical protein